MDRIIGSGFAETRRYIRTEIVPVAGIWFTMRVMDDEKCGVMDEGKSKGGSLRLGLIAHAQNWYSIGFG
jgi:hypothetical protein